MAQAGGFGGRHRAGTQPLQLTMFELPTVPRKAEGKASEILEHQRSHYIARPVAATKGGCPEVVRI